MDLSLYGGTGIIGSYYNSLYPSNCIPRSFIAPETADVLYLISTTDNQTFKENPYIDINTNLVELMRRLESCRLHGIKTFNFVSSWFVYGPQAFYPIESDTCNPNGFYSITKYTAEKLVKEYCQSFGINYRIFRLGNVYGGLDKGSLKRNALHYLVNQLSKNKDIYVHINVSRDFIHIHDACRALNFLCSKSPVNEIYNVGTGKAVKLGAALDDAKLLLKSQGCVFRKAIPGDYQQSISFRLNCKKLQALGFECLIPFNHGLKDLCTHQRFSIPDPTLTGKKLKQLFQL